MIFDNKTLKNLFPDIFNQGSFSYSSHSHKINATKIAAVCSKQNISISLQSFENIPWKQGSFGHPMKGESQYVMFFLISWTHTHIDAS